MQAIQESGVSSPKYRCCGAILLDDSPSALRSSGFRDARKCLAAAKYVKSSSRLVRIIQKACKWAFKMKQQLPRHCLAPSDNKIVAKETSRSGPNKR